MMMLRLKRLRNSLSKLPGWCWGKQVAVALERNNLHRFPLLPGAIRRSGDRGINLGEKFRKLLKNDSF
ncbi:hypothetical protein ACC786_11990 [Rhizobium ruizarguesonis]|uniref:hypothetical protein n=1 Tax=Rhizobium ruizarguesonis TaxID=2081791 RepID=UPI001031B255|nr:hypothetical protein [Rhizobium ruizarguesonis]TBA33762.1 hypothetical protein ELH62_32470 [Rhizobium ruizarguesonis]TBB60067.1 hypothetical protein ELH42_29980 [Rhizobium ruizarguesonis]